MKLFINSGVCERIWKGNIEIKHSEGKSQLCLYLPNYLEDKKKEENIEFIFNNIKGLTREALIENDIFLKKISLSKMSKNSYQIESSKKRLEPYMYALIRSTACLPDDVFIPACKKHKVTVLQRMRFIDAEVDLGQFLSNVYLIAISLDCHESIPIYLASCGSNCLEQHYVFYKTDFDETYGVSKELKTFIYIDKYNKNQYISLSKLCN